MHVTKKKMEGNTMRLQYPVTIPLEAQYLFRRGREMIAQQRADIALVYLRQAVFIAPDFLKAYQELGNCLAWLGRPEEAAAYYWKAAGGNSQDNNLIASLMKGKRQSRNNPFPPKYPQSQLS
jgi:tetratricopeptide (TPR) repeat protein